MADAVGGDYPISRIRISRIVTFCQVLGQPLSHGSRLDLYAGFPESQAHVTGVSDADFADFVARRWTALFRTAYLLTGQVQAAEDLAQTALMKVYANRSSIKELRALESFTRRTMTNEFVSRMRRRRFVDSSYDDQRDSRLLPDHADATVARRILAEALTKLPAKQKAILVLRYFEDLTIEQSAEAMGCSQGAVKKQTHRALAALREQLADLPPLEVRKVSHG